MASAPKNRKEAEELLAKRAVEDLKFRKELLSNPRAVIARELNVQFPESVKLSVVEESPTNLYFILPPVRVKPTSDELDGDQLDAVVGGAARDTELGKGNLQPQTPGGNVILPGNGMAGGGGAP